jgi:CRP/FNR family transcriptional regulator
VAHVPIFAGLPADQQQMVMRLAHSVRVAAGEPVYAPDDQAASLIVVHSGVVKTFRRSAEGAEQMLRVLGPGDFSGETAVLTGRQPQEFAQAVTNAQLCVFSHRDLTELIRRRPDVGLHMLAALGRRLGETEDRLSAVTTRDVSARLASYLLGLPAARHDGMFTVTLPLSKRDIASLLDTTPESLSRGLGRLSDQGLITVAKATVTLLDVDGLRAIAGEE